MNYFLAAVAAREEEYKDLEAWSKAEVKERQVWPFCLKRPVMSQFTVLAISCRFGVYLTSEEVKMEKRTES